MCEGEGRMEGPDQPLNDVRVCVWGPGRPMKPGQPFQIDDTCVGGGEGEGGQRNYECSQGSQKLAINAGVRCIATERGGVQPTIPFRARGLCQAGPRRNVAEDDTTREGHQPHRMSRAAIVERLAIWKG